jgi:hypothetical protein
VAAIQNHLSSIRAPTASLRHHVFNRSDQRQPLIVWRISPRGFLIGAHRHGEAVVCTENLIRVADVMESPKLAE